MEIKLGLCDRRKLRIPAVPHRRGTLQKRDAVVVVDLALLGMVAAIR